MPWTGAQFAERHNHGMTPAQATHASHIANAILRRSGDEGMAIATANKLAHRDIGGMVDPTSPSLGGIAPSSQTMNPQTQALVQRYSSLPAEKLQELSAQLGSSPQGAIIKRVLQQKLAMPQGMQPVPQQQQPVANVQSPPGYAGGGSPMGVSMSMAEPWWTRSEASGDARGSATGFLNGDTAGRADSIKTQAPSGSYVLPADVVAGLGEGNSLAGARVVQSMLSTGPHGVPMPRGGGRNTIPKPPPLSDLREFAAKGGGVQDDGGDMTPVALSHGEMVLTAPEVMILARLVTGKTPISLKQAHSIMDHFTVHVRQRVIKKMQSLPAPVGMKKAA
jgi:hypothetical protein